MNNIKRGQIAQNIYSAQSCNKGTESQTEHDMRGKKKETGFHWKTRAIRSPMFTSHQVGMRVLFPLEQRKIGG